MATQEESKRVEYGISNGPGKWDLMLSLFEPLGHWIDLGMEQTFKEFFKDQSLRLHVELLEIHPFPEIEEWEFRAWSDLGFKVEGIYSTKTRKGKLWVSSVRGSMRMPNWLRDQFREDPYLKTLL